MTRKVVYEALEKLQSGEIMKPDVMDVIDSWLMAEMLELNATNSGLRYAASELEFRVDKQNEHISIQQDQLKEAENYIEKLCKAAFKDATADYKGANIDHWWAEFKLHYNL